MPRRSPRWQDVAGSLAAALWPVVLTLLVLGDPSRYDPYAVYSGAGSVRLHALHTLPTTDPNIYSTAFTLGVRSASMLVHGHLPWWNPFEGLGAPLIGEFESGGLFPFTPLLLVHDGSLVFHLTLEAIAGLATYWLLREFRCSPVIAALGGMLYATNGTFAWLGNAAFNPVCFLPVMVLGVERARRAAIEGRGGGWRWLAVGGALALVAGFIETAALGLVLVVVLALQRGCTIEPRKVAAFARKVVAGLAAGIALAAPVLVAFDDYLRFGYVHLHGGDAAARHLTTTYVAMSVSPYLFGRIGENAYPGIHDMWGAIGGYAGFALLALAVASLFGRRDRGLRIVLAAWVFLSLTDSVGMTPVRQLFSALPVLQHIVLYRYLPPTWELALVVLAAFALRDAATATRVQSLLALSTGVLCSACVLLVGIALAPREVQASRASTATSFHQSELLVVAVAAALLLAVAAGPRLRMALVGVVAVAEAAVLFAIPLASWPTSAPVDTAMVGYLTSHVGTARFFSLGPPGANFGTQFAIRQLDIVDLPVPNANVPLYRALDPFEDPTVFTGVHGPAVVAPPVPQLLVAHLMRFEDLGVEYVVAPPSVHAFEHRPRLATLVYQDRYFDVWRLHHARPLVRAPGCAIRPTSLDSYVVRCAHRSALLRDELYFPGWSATVNGRSSTVLDRASFQAVALPAGRSVVALTYLPPNVPLAAIASLLAAISLLVPWSLLAAWRRRRRARGDEHHGLHELGRATARESAAPEVAPAPEPVTGAIVLAGTDEPLDGGDAATSAVPAVVGASRSSAHAAVVDPSPATASVTLVDGDDADVSAQRDDPGAGATTPSPPEGPPDREPG